MAPIEEAGRLGLALGLAVFIGLAFEGVYKRDAPVSPGGIRTFPMLAMLGAVLFLIDRQSLLPFVAGLLAVAAWLFAHIRARPAIAGDLPSLMIPTTNLLAYLLGPLALTQSPWIVAGVAVAAVLFLESREQLHRLARLVPPDEIFTAGKFLILVGVILPLLPNHPLFAWMRLTPFQVWLALVAISTLSYLSYLLQRYLPEKSGALLPAILGGLYSSTATTVVLAREQRQAAAPQATLSAGIVAATAIMYLRINVVVGLFDPNLALALLPALLGLFLLGAAIAALEWRRRRTSTAGQDIKIQAANPLQLGTAVAFAVIFVVVSVISTWARARFGEAGIFALAGVVGTTDIDPFVLSIAQGGVPDMSKAALAAAILIAASSNNAIKAVYALAFGGMGLCRRPALWLLALSLAGLGATMLYLR